jgi:hypothetical protein
VSQLNSIAHDLLEAACPLPLGPFRIDHRIDRSPYGLRRIVGSFTHTPDRGTVFRTRSTGQGRVSRRRNGSPHTRSLVVGHGSVLEQGAHEGLAWACHVLSE